MDVIVKLPDEIREEGDGWSVVEKGKNIKLKCKDSKKLNKAWKRKDFGAKERTQNDKTRPRTRPSKFCYKGCEFCENIMLKYGL